MRSRPDKPTLNPPAGRIPSVFGPLGYKKPELQPAVRSLKLQEGSLPSVFGIFEPQIAKYRQYSGFLSLRSLNTGGRSAAKLFRRRPTAGRSGATNHEDITLSHRPVAAPAPPPGFHVRRVRPSRSARGCRAGGRR